MPKEKSPVPSGKRIREIISVIKKYNLIKELDAENLKKACEDLGPCFVKLGQMAAMRSDIIPSEICEELLLLCNDVRPMTDAEVTAALEEAYQKPVAEMFTDFDWNPHGSASLAQVHFATLTTGERVAVKVQRPGVRESMLSDIAAMEKMIAKFSKSKLVKALDLVTLIRIFKETTLEELDFLHEAENIIEYSQKNEDISYCEAPLVYMPLCTEKVLVMECVEGPHLGDYEELREENYDFSDMAAKYVKNLMKQVLVDGLCHYDPHPANIKVRNGKLVWFDWGMAGHFSSGERELVRKFYIALSERDAVTLTECFILLNIGEKEPDKAKLYQGLKKLLDKTNVYDINDLNIGAMLKSVMNLLRESHVILSSAYFMLFRSFGTMQALTMKLDPEADLGKLILNGITQTMRETCDPKEELDKWLGQRLKNWKKIASIPVNLAEMIRNLSGNLTGMKIDINIPDNTQNFMTWMTKILIEGLIIVSLIISSSIVTAANFDPKILGIPILGFIGYLAAAVVGILMLITFKKK